MGRQTRRRNEVHAHGWRGAKIVAVSVPSHRLEKSTADEVWHAADVPGCAHGDEGFARWWIGMNALRWRVHKLKLSSSCCRAAQQASAVAPDTCAAQ